MLDVKHPIQNGYITVPDGPGLGVDLDEDAIAEHIPDDQPMWK